MPITLGKLRLLVMLAVVYFAAGKLGLSFATPHDSASAVWPPTGIALSAFLLFGYRVWPAIFLGAFLVNVTTSGAMLASIGIAIGNTLEGLAGAYLVERFAGGRAWFERARDVFRFAALAAILATTISATVGVGSLTLAGAARWEELGAIWLTWWLGDAVGALIVTPLVLAWYAAPRPILPREHPGEAAFLLLTVVVVAAACFAAPGLRDYPLSFLCLPPLAWIAFRFGAREVATAIVLLTAISVAATKAGLGPFATFPRGESLLLLQAFMGMVAITLLPMAALVREHRLAVAEAEAATRARDIFLAMLSHELRNPLQAIAASLHLLGRKETSPEEASSAVAIANRQSEHLSGLLNDLLDVARAVSGKIRLEPRPARLDEIVQRCVEVTHGSRRLKGRKLTFDGNPVTVHADPSRVEQIVGNLLSNAIKFTLPGGSIRVSVGVEGANAVLRVRDDGIGIAPELLPGVFDLFTQGERAMDRREGGLGIGLTLVRTLAELHGGSAEARSDGAGRGTELIVRLRLADEAAEAGHLPVAPSLAALSRRVLLVEDNDDAREALRAALMADGHEVHEAADGSQGVAIAERVRPEIVFVDIGLPEIDGYEVARRLRAKEVGLGIRWRLIALTGYGQPEDVQRALEAGFDAHLVKPVFPAALQQLLAGTRTAR